MLIDKKGTGQSSSVQKDQQIIRGKITEIFTASHLNLAPSVLRPKSPSSAPDVHRPTDPRTFSSTNNHRPNHPNFELKIKKIIENKSVIKTKQKLKYLKRTFSYHPNASRPSSQPVGRLYRRYPSP